MTKTKTIWIAAATALVFGALTVFSGGQALFGSAAARAAVGNAVPFVLWFNFLSGFAYILAGIGIAGRQAWAASLAKALVVAILAVFVLLGWHILRGGTYEMRTIAAMTLRAAIWIGIVLALRSPTKPQ